jgi:predicted nucleic acid-binding protein
MFISYFKGEERPEIGVTDAIKYYFKEIEKGNVLLATSALTKAEVLEYQIGEDQYKKFLDFLELENIDVIETNSEIWRVAGEIRNHFGKQDPKYFIETADSVHLSTAIYYNADEFQTLDSKDNKKKGTKGLIPLKPSMQEKYKLTICLPTIRFRGSTEHLFSEQNEQSKEVEIIEEESIEKHEEDSPTTD